MARPTPPMAEAALRYLHTTAAAARAMAEGIDDELRQAMASGEPAPDKESTPDEWRMVR